MKVSINVKGDDGIRRALNELSRSTRPALANSINQTAADLRGRVIQKSTEIYNISPRELAPFVSVRRASASTLSGSIRLDIRAVPIEAFKPRIAMQQFTFSIRGRTVTRTLPAVFLKRFRKGSERYVRPAFPLTQRTSGTLQSGEKIRRRTGTDRQNLTALRYYTFPRLFIDQTLLPDAQKFVPERVSLQLRAAFRRFDRRGVNTLRGNRG